MLCITGFLLRLDCSGRSAGTKWGRAGPLCALLKRPALRGPGRVSRDAKVLAAASTNPFSALPCSACSLAWLRVFGDLDTACGLFDQKLGIFGFFGRISGEFVALRGVFWSLSLEF